MGGDNGYDGLMGMSDKISGRVKQAAGDLAGRNDLKREGRREERKGEAREELHRAQAAADGKAAEVRNLERRTDPDALAQDTTRDELYERAQELDIPGRSDMSKDELAEAVRRHDG